MAKVVHILVGLPGSGKTRKFKNLARKATGLAQDDFLNHIVDKAEVQREVRFNDSIHYKKLITDLRRGKECVISDIVFCDTWVRHEAQIILESDVPDVEIDWIYFENSPRKCMANSKRRGRKETLDRELRLISSLSAKYIIPQGVKALKVWAPK